MAPEPIDSVTALRRRVSAARAAGQRVGCVPTMGALHAGHAALFDRARADCDLLVATLFVNPLQFDREDDLRSYPRDLESDLETCRRHGVDLLFSPPVEEMYPRPPVVSIDVGSLASGLCGASRPGHFRGVATVVLKLLNVVQPDMACFGEKDYQQLVIVRRLVEEVNLPVRIVGVRTVRDSDGLALSSRNALLGPGERAAALAIPRELAAARDAVQAGEDDARALCERAAESMREESLLRLDYFEIVDPGTLELIGRILGPVRIVAAAFAGSTRLIDNLPAAPPQAG